MEEYREMFSSGYDAATVLSLAAGVGYLHRSSQSFNMSGEGNSQGSSPRRGSVAGCWLLGEGERVFLGGVASARQPMLEWMPHTREHWGSTDWTQRVKRRGGRFEIGRRTYGGAQEEYEWE